VRGSVLIDIVWLIHLPKKWLSQYFVGLSHIRFCFLMLVMLLRNLQS
jgi:hypothetical protein